jgi:hypothetical protein
MGDDAELVPVISKRDTEKAVAQPYGIPHDRLEYLLDVGAGAADHLQDLTGRVCCSSASLRALWTSPNDGVRAWPTMTGSSGVPHASQKFAPAR